MTWSNEVVSQSSKICTFVRAKLPTPSDCQMIPTSIASGHKIGDTGPVHGRAQPFHYIHTQPLPLGAVICIKPHCYLRDVGLGLGSIVALVVSSTVALGVGAGSDVTEELTGGISVVLGVGAGSDVTEE